MTGVQTCALPISKEDGRIDWTRSAEEIERLVRGLDPWPSAYTFLDDARLRLFAPEVEYLTCDSAPGSILRADSRGLLVACGKHAINFKELQPEGKKRMAVAAFCCGRPVPVGTVLQARGGESDD